MRPDVISAGWRRLVFVGISLAALGLYVRTLAPSVATLFDDSLEFQLVPVLLAIPHPTGYPLYALLGRLATLVPFGDAAYRVNLLSAVAAAVAVGLTFLAAEDADDRWSSTGGGVFRTMGAICGALALMVAPVFWSQATIAEVYALHLVFTAGILVVLLRIAETRVSRAWTAVEWTRRLAMLALLFGLGLAHHRMVLLLAPAAAWVCWDAWPRTMPAASDGRRQPVRMALRPVQWLLPAAALLLPLLLYAYLPLRAHVGSLDGTYQNTWPGFWRYVTASGYGGFIFDNPLGVERGPGFYAGLFWRQFGPVGIALGALGLVSICRRKNAAVTILAFALTCLFAVFYQVADVEVFFLPAFVIWAIWLGLGAGWLARRLALHGGRSHHAGRWAALLAPLLVVTQVGWMVYSNWDQMDRSRDWKVFDYGRDVLAQPLKRNAAVVGIQGEMTLVRYFQETQGTRTDVQPVTADAPEKRLEAVQYLVDEGRAVYLTRDLAGARERWSLEATGPLIRVLPQPMLSPPEVEVPLDVSVTPEVQLAGYSVSRPPTHGRVAPVRLMLVWQSLAVAPADLKVSARLTTAGGAVVAQSDGVPVWFAYPMTAWRPGEYVSDVYDLSPADDLPEGEYTPVLVVYDPAQGAAEVGRVILSPVRLP